MLDYTTLQDLENKLKPLKEKLLCSQREIYELKSALESQKTIQNSNEAKIMEIEQHNLALETAHQNHLVFINDLQNQLHLKLSEYCALAEENRALQSAYLNSKGELNKYVQENTRQELAKATSALIELLVLINNAGILEENDHSGIELSVGNASDLLKSKLQEIVSKCSILQNEHRFYRSSYENYRKLLGIQEIPNLKKEFECSQMCVKSSETFLAEIKSLRARLQVHESFVQRLKSRLIIPEAGRDQNITLKEAIAEVRKQEQAIGTSDNLKWKKLRQYTLVAGKFAEGINRTRKKKEMSSIYHDLESIYLQLSETNCDTIRLKLKFKAFLPDIRQLLDEHVLLQSKKDDAKEMFEMNQRYKNELEDLRKIEALLQYLENRLEIFPERHLIQRIETIVHAFEHLQCEAKVFKESKLELEESIRLRDEFIGKQILKIQPRSDIKSDP
jgi:hypothetical protein